MTQNAIIVQKTTKLSAHREIRNGIDKGRVPDTLPINNRLCIFTIENLNLRNVLKKNYKFKYHDKYLWVIHTIINLNIEIDNSFKGYVNINYKLLEKFLGSRYTSTILSHLEEGGIIEHNHAYSAGSFSGSYRLTEPYRDMPYSYSEPMPIAYAGKLLAHRKQYLDKIFKEDNSTGTPKLEYLYNNMTSINLCSEVLGYIDTLELSKDQRFNYLCSSKMIMNKDYRFKHDARTGRVFHNISNYPRKLRKFLSYESSSTGLRQRLFHVDIKNSQVVLFNVLLKDIITEDTMLFRKLTLEGTFYEYLMDKLEYKGSRDTFKSDFFKKIYYAEVHDKWEYTYAKKFKKLFPTVWNLILEFKKDNHADLPIALQKLESEIVVQKVSPILAKEGIFFITVHDCIVCLEEDTIRVQKLLKHELYKLIGFIPALKTEEF